MVVSKTDYDKLQKLQYNMHKYFELARMKNSWSALYHYVFSDNVLGEVERIVPDFDWYDPDKSYRADVCAFIGAFDLEMNNITIIDYDG